jgi:putative CocE/NonD family hydrolase
MKGAKVLAWLGAAVLGLTVAFEGPAPVAAGLQGRLAPSASARQRADYVRANYVKQEHQVPMRDGVKLFTSIYVPKDTSRTHPILLNRTPYSVAPYGPDAYRSSLGPSDLFIGDGYIFVYQDVRGRLMSEGEFEDVRPYVPAKSGPKDIDETTDTYDTIEWLLKNVPNHNGKVGMYGISYPGFYAAMGAISHHSALKAVSPQAPIADWFIGDDWHHNGALYLAHAFGFYAGFGWPRPKPTTQPGARFDYETLDGYRFYLALGPLSRVNERYFKGQVKFWNDLMAHETYDAFWQARNSRPHLKGIRPAMLTVGGWFDAEDLFGALEVYKNIERQNPGMSNALVMGPWSHGGWARTEGSRLGDVTFGSKTSQYYQEKIEYPFFQSVLTGDGTHGLAEATVFETGRNRWHSLPEWPPREAARRALYLHAGGRLSFDPPGGAASDFDEYVSDPAKPVPFTSGTATGMTREHMVEDQRFASQRADVLVYQTDPLAEDLTVAGPIWPHLVVSTTGTDSDFVVKVIDVYPEDYPDPDAKADDPDPWVVPHSRMGGYQQLVRGEVFRGKFRRSFERPEPFVPSEPTAIDYVMPDVFHTFRRGHRVMIQIQSTWFPLVNLNPQRFLNINEAKESDFQKATQRVYRGKGRETRIELAVLPR